MYMYLSLSIYIYIYIYIYICMQWGEWAAESPEQGYEADAYGWAEDDLYIYI